ncbi:MAG: hypothetical protein AAFR96_09520 [Planctomycetota bacterium]
MLGQIVDGRSAWAAFYEGVTDTFESNVSSLPWFGVAVGAVVVVYLHVRSVRWALRRFGGSSSEAVSRER